MSILTTPKLKLVKGWGHGNVIILVPKVLLTRHLIRRLVLNHYSFVQTFQPVIVIYIRVNLFIIIWGVHKFIAHCIKNAVLTGF